MLQTSNRLRRPLFSTEFNQTPTNKLKTVTSSITREISDTSDRIKEKSQVGEPELLNDEQFVLTLCKNFQAKKFKIRPTNIARGDQNMNQEDNKTLKEHRWGKIRTKI